MCTIIETLHNDGIHLSAPSQSGIYKAVYREAEKLKLNLKENLKNDSWCLHFDRKILNNKEHKEVVLKNEFKEVRLSILALPNGQAKTFRLHNDVIHLSAKNYCFSNSRSFD
jgi:hypothetical protein